MIKKETLIAVLLFGSAVFSSATPAQTLRIGLTTDLDTLDPTLSRTFSSRVVRVTMCDRLFDIGLELEIVPQLATEWKWTDDKKGLVIRLRPGVKFHDGEPFDAAAVKYNIERHLTMAGSTVARDISAISSVEIIDDHTVKLVLSAPFAPLLTQLAGSAGVVVSPKAAQAAGENFGSHPVCAGPFKFVERVAQDRIVVERLPITGTRTRSTSTASSTCRSRTRLCASPICSRRVSTSLRWLQQTSTPFARIRSLSSPQSAGSAIPGSRSMSPMVSDRRRHWDRMRACVRRSSCRSIVRR